jgi:hypothetical protein
MALAAKLLMVAPEWVRRNIDQRAALQREVGAERRVIGFIIATILTAGGLWLLL